MLYLSYSATAEVPKLVSRVANSKCPIFKNIHLLQGPGLIAAFKGSRVMILNLEIGFPTIQLLYLNFHHTNFMRPHFASST